MCIGPLPLQGAESVSTETLTDACPQQRAALETTLCVPVEAMNSSQLTSAVQVDEISNSIASVQQVKE